MRIIDFHTHPFYEKNENVCMYDNTVLDSEDFKNTLTNWGIDMFCGSVIRHIDGTDFSQVKALNDSALKLKAKWGDFYQAGVHFHPNFVRESCDELERCKNLGVKMVGELVPYFMGWEDYFVGCKPIYDCIEQLGFSCVSLHTMNEETMEAAVKEFKNITFVAAHPNDKQCFLRHIERMKKYPNYCLDLSGTGIFRYGLIKYGIEQVGSERFLFGSDFPICNCKMYIACVDGEKISDRDKENILYRNAERILNL